MQEHTERRDVVNDGFQTRRVDARLSRRQEEWPAEDIQDSRPKNQPNQDLAEDGRLPDPGRQAACQFCGRDRQREKKKELEDVGHQDVLKRLVSIPCFRSR